MPRGGGVTSGPSASQRAEKEKAFKEAREQITALLKSAAEGELETFNTCVGDQAAGDNISETEVLSHTKDGNKRGPLHFAAQGGKVPIVERIIAMAGGDEALLKTLVDAKDGEDETPLVLASRDFSDNGLGVVKALIQQGKADVNISSQSGTTALHHAVDAGSVELTEFLLQSGADVNAGSDTGTPLLHAVMYSRQEALAVLLAHSADVNKSTGNAPPPMHAACSMGNATFVTALITAGSDMDVRDSDGWTALHAAVDGGHREIADMLRAAGIDIGARAKDGKTAADLAVAQADPERHKELQPVTRPADRPSLDRETRDRIELLKAAGNEALKRGELKAAAASYSEAIALDGYNAILFNNRSAANLKLKKLPEALADAQKARELAPEVCRGLCLPMVDWRWAALVLCVGFARRRGSPPPPCSLWLQWIKVFYREGECFMAMQNYGDAAASFWEGLMFDAGNRVRNFAYKRARRAATVRARDAATASLLLSTAASRPLQEMKKRFDTALALGKAEHKKAGGGEADSSDSDSDDDEVSITPTVFSR